MDDTEGRIGPERAVNGLPVQEGAGRVQELTLTKIKECQD